MRKILLTICAMSFVLVAFSQQLASNVKPANPFNAKDGEFAWFTTQYDFGEIKVGVPVTYEFTFSNNGDSPLIITSVQASCGCTVASYTKDPIEAAGTGFVKATYNAAKVGQFTKTVTVNANTKEGVVVLTIKGEVIE